MEVREEEEAPTCSARLQVWAPLLLHTLCVGHRSSTWAAHLGVHGLESNPLMATHGRRIRAPVVNMEPRLHMRSSVPTWGQHAAQRGPACSYSCGRTGSTLCSEGWLVCTLATHTLAQPPDAC